MFCRCEESFCPLVWRSWKRKFRCVEVTSRSQSQAQCLCSHGAGCMYSWDLAIQLVSDGRCSTVRALQNIVVLLTKWRRPSRRFQYFNQLRCMISQSGSMMRATSQSYPRLLASATHDWIEYLNTWCFLSQTWGSRWLWAFLEQLEPLNIWMRIYEWFGHMLQRRCKPCCSTAQTSVSCSVHCPDVVVELEVLHEIMRCGLRNTNECMSESELSLHFWMQALLAIITCRRQGTMPLTLHNRCAVLASILVLQELRWFLSYVSWAGARESVYWSLEAELWRLLWN